MTFVYKRSFANVVTNSYLPVGFVTVIDTNLVSRPLLLPVISHDQYHDENHADQHRDGRFLSPPHQCVRLADPVERADHGDRRDRHQLDWSLPTCRRMRSAAHTSCRALPSPGTPTIHLAYFGGDCVTNEPGLRRGIEKITFVKTAYDSMLGKFYAPQTNYFTMTTVTNSTNWVRNVPARRDRAGLPVHGGGYDARAGRAGDSWFQRARAASTSTRTTCCPDLAGPGTIDPPDDDYLQQIRADLLQHRHEQ